MALTAKREKFAQECAAGKSAADAYRAAFSADNMTATTLWRRAHDVKTNSKVAARIEELQAVTNLATKTLFTKTVAEIRAAVLQDAWDVVHADASELTTYRRLNCRHCHGTGHAYRWRDEAEFWESLAVAAEKQDQWDNTAPERRRGKRPALPTDDGGYGWRMLHPPSPNCPKCEGEGIADARVADIRTLDGPARRLFAGVELKKDGGIKVHTRDKEAARLLLAKHAGMIIEKMQHSGTVGLVPMQLSDLEKRVILEALEKDI